jgi:hypothetical protein
VPSNDESLVRTIRNLLLNVDDTAPMIPLTRPKPTTDVRNFKSATGRNHMAANEEAIQTARGPAINESSTKEPKEKYEAGATTNKWNCDFSRGSSDSSSVSRMEVELPKDNAAGTSNPDFTNKESTACDQSQPTILRDGSSKCTEDSRGVVVTKSPFQNPEDTPGNKNCALPPTSILQRSALATSNTSSSSSDDGSVSSSSSDSGSDATSTSSSSSDSSSSSSSSSTG